MPGIATGESYSFAEGKLYLYASASGATSGSGIGFAEEASLRLAYGWRDYQRADGAYERQITGQRADLDVGTLFGDLTLFRLANSKSAVNAKFEGLVTGGLGQSAQWLLYSGAIDECEVSQAQGGLWKGKYHMHANVWSAVGQ